MLSLSGPLLEQTQGSVASGGPRDQQICIFTGFRPVFGVFFLPDQYIEPLGALRRPPEATEP